MIKFTKKPSFKKKRFAKKKIVILDNVIMSLNDSFYENTFC